MSAWQADVLTKLDYDRPRQSTFSTSLKPISTKTEENIINTLIALKSNGKSDGTIKTISYKLKQLARECNLNNPNEVKLHISELTNQKTKQPLSNATKHKFTVAYDHYCKTLGIEWKKPKYKIAETTPLIPTTENVDAIINHASKKYITIFTILKETGFAPKELANTTHKDIDTEQGIIRVKGVKGHDSRSYKLKPHSAEMLRIYLHKHTEEHPFPNTHAMSQIWVDTRRRAMKKLCKPELDKIELRNLRNYSGAMFYLSLPIRDPFAVMRHFGHKKLDTTTHYLRAIDIGYQEDDQWITLITKNPEEECKAIEKGYQLVRSINETTAIYKKRK